MYACSPRWRADWIGESDLRRVLEQLSGKIEGSPLGPGRVGINYGIHLTGGEPFLNFDLLLKAVKILKEYEIPSTFVETNCFWCVDDETTRKRMVELRDAGLDGILLSANPFILEYVPFERTERAVRIGREVFGDNVMVYQEFFYTQFKALGVRGTLPFDRYLRKAGLHSLYYAELLPMGRAVYRLGRLFRRYPARRFFGASCREELTRGWHFHVDNYCNYMTGYCGGISLGDARNLDALLEEGVDLDDHPILDALVHDIGRLYELAAEEYGYGEREEGYVSKCHLCLDIRRHVAEETDEFKELRPREFYLHV